MINSHKAVVIGAGNLSWSLIPGLQKAGIEVIQMISRNFSRATAYASEYKIEKISDKMSEISQEADLIFLCVSDGAIAKLALEIRETDAIVIHCSGSVELEVLKSSGKQTGVFYPMQVFTRQMVVDFAEVPLFIEGEEEVQNLLISLGRRMSNKVYEMDSRSRLFLHLGAVMVTNFTNYIYRQANRVAIQPVDLDFDIYESLIRSHIKAVLEKGPEETQTGPAIRGDEEVIQKHMKVLSSDKELKQLYGAISYMINPELGHDTWDAKVD